MKMFGMFLVDHGLIDEGTLLQALMKQIAQTPSFAEVVFEQQLLSPDMQLKILDVQSRTGSDYRAALGECGVDVDDLCGKAASFINQTRRPLGQILVDGGKVSPAELTSALDEYFGILTEEPEEASAATKPLVVQETPPDVQSVGATFDASEMRFGKIDQALFEEFRSILSVEVTERLGQAIDGLSALGSEAERRSSVESMLKDLNQASSAAHFVKAELSLALIGRLSKWLCSLLETDCDSRRIVEVASHGSASIKVLEGVMARIKADRSERSFWEDPGSRSEFERVFAALEPLHREAA